MFLGCDLQKKQNTILQTGIFSDEQKINPYLQNATYLLTIISCITKKTIEVNDKIRMY